MWQDNCLWNYTEHWITKITQVKKKEIQTKIKGLSVFFSPDYFHGLILSAAPHTVGLAPKGDSNLQHEGRNELPRVEGTC